QQGEARLASDAAIVTTTVDNWTATRLELVHAVAKMPAVVRLLEAGDAASAEDLAFASALGMSFRESVSDVVGVSLLDHGGVVRASQTAQIGTNFGNRDYFQNAIKGGDFISGV